MEIFNLKEMKSFPYSKRDKNVFYSTKEFKARIINLSAGEEIPSCKMPSYVIFYIIDGEAVITVNSKELTIETGKCLITEPAILSVKTVAGVKMMGIQINKN